MEFKRKTNFGYTKNKDIIIRKIKGINIENFRLFDNEKIDLGSNITVFSGRNGTMKSTVMGLISHIYRTTEKNVFGNYMQTRQSEIFRLSISKDNEKYLYHILFEDIENNLITEPVEIYVDSNKKRHRIVPSSHESDGGFFKLCSVYLNLKRLYPLVDIPRIDHDKKAEYSQEENDFISDFYEKILLRDEFNSHEHYTAVKSGIKKFPIGPKDSYYDVDALSSGEDNLSQIVGVLVSFMRVYKSNSNNQYLTGILAIDEFDSSLHPIAQLNLFKYLLKWSKQYNVQLLISTHSLYLIKEVLFMRKEIQDGEIVINFITNGYKPNNKLSILKNPTYSTALKELSLKTEQPEEIKKLQIYVEDEIASHCLKRILNSILITERINIVYKYNDSQGGISWTLLKSIANNFGNILTETMSIIVFDQDVDITLKLNYKYVLRFPRLTATPMPFEKELIVYILQMDSNNKFFAKNNTSKEILRQEFAEYKIPLSIEKIKESKKLKQEKEWFNNNLTRNKEFLSYMINDNSKIYEEFRENFISISNEILKINSLPEINLERS
ncbi:ATP-binding protein [Staphylococcus felis]|uniref:ATP-binding protein n=1 Tax=Staphylococcus felis TaxID=46127 RepID=UPI0021CEF283|nr:ATP-binding protein [Staphylococcus felis]UXR86220.1 ATP-binding protein [Staphylococcus felis]